jgi:hypothetical protein
VQLRSAVLGNGAQMDDTFERRRDREDDVRAAVEAADDTGLVRQAEIRVEHDLEPVDETDAADDEPPART